MTNLTLTILFFLSLFTSPNDDIRNDVENSEPLVAMESDLVITEIMYNPSGADTDWEWIEIYNSGVTAIDLSGYVLDDNSAAQLGAANIVSGTLEPQQSAVLFDADGVTIEEFQEVWGNVNVVPVTNWSSLGNGAGDSIGIWDSYENYDNDNQTQSNTIEQVVYKNNEDFWPDDDGNSSIYLIALDFDNSMGGNWALSSVNQGEEMTPLFNSYTSTRGDIGSPGSMESEDTTPPTIECPEMIEIGHDEGLCSSVVPLLLPSATDNVSIDLIFNAVRSDGLELEEPFPVGDTMITWTATDDANNTSLPCEQLVRVTEVELPTAIAQNITVELDENGVVTILPEDLNNTDTPSFDNCGIEEYMSSRTEFTCEDLGAPVFVEFTVLDANGNTSTASNVEVTVVDLLKPIITCSADLIATSSNGNAVLLEDVVEPLVTDNCDESPIVSFVRSDEQELNAPFDVGTTTITWQAVDVSGNAEECTQTIVVDFVASMDNDIVAFSILEQIGETEIDNTAKTIDLLMPIGTDLTDLTPIFEISEDATSIPESQETVDFTESFVYVIIAQDGSEQEWTVTVVVEEDTTPPTFVVKGNTEDFITELEVGDVYMVGEIMNIIDESITVSEILGDDQVNTSSPGGPFLVTYSVSDGSNTTTITESVIVKEVPELLAITSFTLVNAETNEDIFLIEEAMEINSNDLPTLNLNVRANATAEVMSTSLAISGGKSFSRTENVFPFALFGDLPAGEYFGREFGLGSYTVSAIPYAEKNKGGEIGEQYTVDFSIIDPCESFEISVLDVFDNSTCEGADGFALIEYSGGVEPVVYSWSHDSELNQNSATGLDAGNYSVMATDANNCIAQLTFEIEGPMIPEVTLSPFETVQEDDATFMLSGGSPVGGVYSGEGVLDGSFDPSIGPGSYEITYTFTDGRTACSNSALQTIEVLPTTLKVQSFTLVNADTFEDIMDLSEGMRIDVESLSTMNLDIRANTTTDVESVRLMLSGEMLTTRTENFEPYALYGDAPAGNYFGNEFKVGYYTVTATPFAGNQLKGEEGTSLTINFELYSSEISGKSANSMNVYPNPAIVETTLSFKKPADLQVIYLYDVLGRMVGSYKGSTIETNGKYVLEVESIPAGTYYIKSRDAKGNAYHKQVIIKK